MIERLRNTVRTVPDFPTPGIQFKDITTVLADPELLRFAAQSLAAPYRESGITQVLGIEARGFILGGMLADILNVGFIPIRKAGKLPFKTISETYDLEYGTDTIEMHIDAVAAGNRVLIHDDVIATGGTAAAACRLARKGGATVVGFSFLVELEGLNGRSLLDPSIPVHSLMPF